jgi:hypothetical protein
MYASYQRANLRERCQKPRPVSDVSNEKAGTP